MYEVVYSSVIYNFFTVVSMFRIIFFFILLHPEKEKNEYNISQIKPENIYNYYTNIQSKGILYIVSFAIILYFDYIYKFIIQWHTKNYYKYLTKVYKNIEFQQLYFKKNKKHDLHINNLYSYIKNFLDLIIKVLYLIIVICTFSYFFSFYLLISLIPLIILIIYLFLSCKSSSKDLNIKQLKFLRRLQDIPVFTNNYSQYLVNTIMNTIYLYIICCFLYYFNSIDFIILLPFCSQFLFFNVNFNFYDIIQYYKFKLPIKNSYKSGIYTYISEELPEFLSDIDLFYCANLVVHHHDDHLTIQEFFQKNGNININNIFDCLKNMNILEEICIVNHNILKIKLYHLPNEIKYKVIFSQIFLFDTIIMNDFLNIVEDKKFFQEYINQYKDKKTFLFLNEKITKS